MTEQYRPEVGHRVRIVIEGPVYLARHASFCVGEANRIAGRDLSDRADYQGADRG